MRAKVVVRLSCLLAVLVIVASVWKYGTAEAVAQRSSAGCCVATLDLNAVLESIEERKEREKELQAFIGTQETKIKELGKEAQQGQDDLKILPQSTKAWQEKREQVIRAGARFRIEQELAKGLVEEKRKNMHLDLFRKINDAAGRYARKEGIAIVISSDAAQQIPDDIQEQAAHSAILNRRVIFADSALDISQAVASMMNNEFKARGAGN